MNLQTPNTPQQDHPEKHSQRIAALATAIAIGAGALAGCSNTDIDARPSISKTSLEASPNPAETDNLTLEEAREALHNFTPVVAYGNYEFSLNPDQQMGTRDAKHYLDIKTHSELAIIDYTGMKPQDLQDFGNTVDERL